MTPEMRNYRVLSAEKKLQQRKSIPDEWTLPSIPSATNVLDIPTTCGILTDIECEITSSYDATTLLEKLKSGTWTAEQVTVAFCKRAAIAQQLVNCLTEIFFDEAIERARQLDQERKSALGGSILTPLWGLPISLKDSFRVKGHDTSTGLGCYVNEPAEENSALAAMLLDLGAVLYCKTNLPQSIMTGDSDNNIFGRTLNPRNKGLTAGGSSGGEGALIALRGSLLGIGTDIMGSIRVPSVCNGLYGFRPSVGLVPHGGVRDLTIPGTDGVHSTAGPMATSIRDCALLLRSIAQADTWRYDSTTISLPWLGFKPKDKLRIGFVKDDGAFTLSPPVRRGMNKAVDSLQRSGRVEVIPLVLPNVQEHINDLIGYCSISGSDFYHEQFARTGEPLVPSLEAIIHLLGNDDPTLKALFDLNVRRAAAARQYLNVFRDNSIDAILMPPAPHTAVPLDKWATVNYTGLWNYLDYPAVVIPVDTVQTSDAADDVSNAKYGENDAKVYSLYSGPELYKNASICVQLVGYKHTDEALANIATIVDYIINGAGPGK